MREAAQRAMQDFAKAQGFPLVMREEVRGDLVCFIGAAPDGREYAIGYRPEA
jgi:hypothetical protein